MSIIYRAANRRRRGKWRRSRRANRIGRGCGPCYDGRVQRREEAMAAVVLQGADIHVPAWVVDLDSFHRWVDSDDVPEHIRIDYLKGEVWIDVSEQQIFSHLRVKA